MSERWREPLKIAAVEHDGSSEVVINGRRYANVDVTLASQEQFERLAQGYVCMQCQEPHEVPFPKACSLCGFPMRAEQIAQLEQRFKGKKWLGPRESDDDEFARMDELNERARKVGLVLPYVRRH